MSDKISFIMDQLNACENGKLLPISSSQIDSFLTVEGTWDHFLFREGQIEEKDPEEKARGLWHEVQNYQIENVDSNYNLLKCNSKNRIHFSGFIVDLMEKMPRLDFPTALSITIKEWKKRWNLRVLEMSFIERMGLFGEMIVLKDLLLSKKIDNTIFWTGRENSDESLHDFVFPKKIFEVKTTLQSEGQIHIFHEDQMHHQNGLELLLVKIDSIETGESLDDLCHEILNILDSINHEDFLNKLDKSGFVLGKYNDDKFIIRERKYWPSKLDSLFIQLDDIDRNIRKPRDISYSVLESNVEFRKIKNYSERLDG